MKLFYCLTCNVVRVFNVFDIEKHGLSRPYEMPCKNCGGPFVSLDLSEVKDQNDYDRSVFGDAQMIQTCVGCVYFTIDYEAGWSEHTPGAGFTMSCAKSRFYFSQNDTQEEFEKAITTAKGCDLFQLKKDFSK